MTKRTSTSKSKTATAAPVAVAEAPVAQAPVVENAAPVANTEVEIEELSQAEIAEIATASEVDNDAVAQVATATHRVSNKLFAGTLKFYSPELTPWVNEKAKTSGTTHMVKFGSVEIFDAKATGDTYVTAYLTKADLETAVMNADAEHNLSRQIGTLYLTPSTELEYFQQGVGNGAVFYAEVPTGDVDERGYAVTRSEPAFFLRFSKKGKWNLYLHGAANNSVVQKRAALKVLQELVNDESTKFIRGIFVNIGIQRKRNASQDPVETAPAKTGLAAITIAAPRKARTSQAGKKSTSKRSPAKASSKRWTANK